MSGSSYLLLQNFNKLTIKRSAGIELVDVPPLSFEIQGSLVRRVEVHAFVCSSVSNRSARYVTPECGICLGNSYQLDVVGMDTRVYGPEDQSSYSFGVRNGDGVTGSRDEEVV